MAATPEEERPEIGVREYDGRRFVAFLITPDDADALAGVIERAAETAVTDFNAVLRHFASELRNPSVRPAEIPRRGHYADLEVVERILLEHPQVDERVTGFDITPRKMAEAVRNIIDTCGPQQ
jgi:hypothetical protein